VLSVLSRHMKPLLSNIGDDKRCDSHTTVLAVRDGKEGWFELYCPGGIACYDDGELYCVMVRWHFWISFVLELLWLRLVPLFKWVLLFGMCYIPFLFHDSICGLSSFVTFFKTCLFMCGLEHWQCF